MPPPRKRPLADNFLTRLGVDVLSAPSSLMGSLDGAFHIGRGDVSPRIVIAEGMSTARRQWVLWHEAAHLVDYAKPSPTGTMLPRKSSLDTEIGRFSEQIAHILEEYRVFLRRLTLTPTIVIEWVSGQITQETLYREARHWDLFIAGMQKRCPEKIAEFQHQRLEFLLLCTPKRRYNELFAEAVACAIRRPNLFARGAPGLMGPLEQIGEATSLPITFRKTTHAMRSVR